MIQSQLIPANNRFIDKTCFNLNMTIHDMRIYDKTYCNFNPMKNKYTHKHPINNERGCNRNAVFPQPVTAPFYINRITDVLLHKQ